MECAADVYKDTVRGTQGFGARAGVPPLSCRGGARHDKTRDKGDGVMKKIIFVMSLVCVVMGASWGAPAVV